MTGAGHAPRMSLARGLSLLTGSVIAVCLLVVLGVAYATLTRTAIASAAEGLTRGTRQLAALAESGIRQSRARYRSAAHDRAIQRALISARITLSSWAVGEAKVAVCIRDTGPGISEGRQAQVFEAFVQLDRSLTQTHEGLGIGLAISRDLARGMSGDSTLRSSPGSGATFILTLPRGLADRASGLITSGEAPALGQA